MEPQGPGREDAGASPEDRAAPDTRLSALLRATPDVVLLLEPTDGGFLCRMAIGTYPSAPGLTDLQGLRMEEILPRDLLQRFEDDRHEALRRQEPVRSEERLGAGDDALVLEITLTPVFDEHGPTGRLFWSVRDVTGEWAVRQALRRAEERAPAELQAELAAERETLEAERAALSERLEVLEEEARRLEEVWAAVRESQGASGFLFREAVIGLAWTDPEGRVLEANRPLATLLGREPGDLPGLTLAEVVPEPERSDLERVLTELRVGALTSAGLDSRVLPLEGEPVPVRVTVTAEPGDGLRRILWQVEDHRERRELQDLLAHQALHDPLTGMPNRALFLDRLGRALARLDRRPGTIAVMVIDLDRFAAVNDEHGHEAGDLVLAQVAERIEHASRASDTVARLESDEFALVCEDLEGGEDALTLTERLREAVERAPVVVNGVTVEVGMSIGIALGHESADRPEALLRDAGAAVREAKAAGRARTEILDEARRARAAQDARTDGDLTLALERGELRLFYQPLVDLHRGVIVGAEALLRWQHPERGLLTPAEFLGRAEESGLIVDIGAWVLEEAFRQSRLWIGTEPITTWVNVSSRQLADGLPDLVSKALAHSGTEPETVGIEVTESVLLEGAAEAIEALREVHDMGISVGIDDFGKGFSSLTSLRDLPVDVVKLDMTFVHGLGAREEDDAISEAVVNLARAMELASVAEGVETPEQLARLRELECDLAQGYLFASPQPPEVVQQLLSQDLRW